MNTKAVLHDQVQAQMEQAVECLNQDQPMAAKRHYEECARLCEILDLEGQMAKEAKKTRKALQEEQKNKQLTIDIPS
jgi:hypothetical protein